MNYEKTLTGGFDNPFSLGDDVDEEAAPSLSLLIANGIIGHFPANDGISHISAVVIEDEERESCIEFPM